ncbi:MAG: sensor histidine kinase, partial [candidate division NC10 bacterium]|nr:sensor histidine kinase [candidate division NC10 bacterium]
RPPAPLQFLEIAVTDTGIGIRPEDLPRLFREFTQLETTEGHRQEGTGLGLVLAKGLVELHGGTIEAASKGEGQGSTFAVVLPVERPAPAKPRGGPWNHRRDLQEDPDGGQGVHREGSNPGPPGEPDAVHLQRRSRIAPWCGQTDQRLPDQDRTNQDPAGHHDVSGCPVRQGDPRVDRRRCRATGAEDRAMDNRRGRRRGDAGHGLSVLDDRILPGGQGRIGLEEAQQSSGRRIFLFRRDGWLAAAAGSGEPRRGVVIPHALSAADPEVEHWGIAPSLLGDRVEVVRVSADSTGHLGYKGHQWFLAIEVPSQDVHARVRRESLGIAVGYGALVFLISIVLLVVIQRRISMTVLDLCGSATRIAGGDLAERVAIRSPEEVGQLGEAFNAMATRLQESQRALGRRAEELEEALRARDEFLANMSHELRTPLNPILGFAHLLEEQARDRLTERQVGYLARIRESGEHLLQSIETILEFVDLETGGRPLAVQRFDPRPALREAVERFGVAATAKGLALELRLADPLPPLQGGPSRLAQILWHLLSNAVKFTPSGGRITVRARTVMAEERRCPSPSPSAPLQFLEIAVTDTGIGIKADDLSRLFTPFRQMERIYSKEHPGLGIGLAFVKRLVDLHGGRIWNESPGQGQGSTFTVLLPFAGLGEARE